MSEHITEKQAQLFANGLLPPNELVQFDDHLTACRECGARLNQAAVVKAAAATLRSSLGKAPHPPFHLAYEQLAGYVDNTLDDVEREIVESHIDDCHECSMELGELRTFSVELRQTLTPRPAPDLAANLARDRVPNPERPRPRTLPERLAAFWLTPAFRIPVSLAAAAALVIAIALIVWSVILPLRKEVADLESQIAEARQQNEDLQKAYNEAKATAGDLQEQLAILESSRPSSQTAADDSLVVALNDGGARVTVDKQGNVEGLPALPAAYDQLAKNALTGERLESPADIKEIAGKALVLMSGAEGGAKDGVAFALTAPVGTVVAADRPAFRWQPVPGATGYQVAIFDADFNQVAVSPPLPSATWTLTKALPRGRLYSWQVTAMREGKVLKSPEPPAPEARFKVLDTGRAGELAQAKQKYSNSNLLMGLIYARAGLLDEAEQEFQSLLRNNPTSAIARKLLTSVRSLRRK